MSEYAKLLLSARERYDERENQREIRADHFEKIIKGKKGGQWWRIDDKERIQARLKSIQGAAAPVVAGFDAFEAILGQNNLVDVFFLKRGFRFAQSVGRIKVEPEALGDRETLGTGFLISESLVITNNHVIPSIAAAERSSLELGNYETPTGLNPSVRFCLDPKRFFVTSDKHDLDFTICAVEPESQGKAIRDFGWNPLIGESGKAIAQVDHVNIVHHPGGGPMKLTVRENQVLDVEGDKGPYMYYLADTDKGSSGAPCFNVNWQVAALHHMGIPRTRPDPSDPKDPMKQQILLKDGSVWDQKPSSEHLIDYISNRGIRISAIVDYVKKQSLSEAKSELFSRSLEDIASVAEGFETISPAFKSDAERPRAASQDLARITYEADGTIVCHLKLSVPKPPP